MKYLFRDLAIGASFDFINDADPMLTSFYLRCHKISARKYRDEHGQEHQVGSVDCVVYHCSGDNHA